MSATLSDIAQQLRDAGTKVQLIYAFNGAGNSLVGNSHLISKVYFPRLIVPLSSIAVALIDFLVMLLLGVHRHLWAPYTYP